MTDTITASRSASANDSPPGGELPLAVPNSASALPGGHLPSAEELQGRLAGAPTAHVDTVLAFLDHVKREGLRSYTEIGKLIKKDGSTISRVFAGKYGADLGAIVRDIDAFLNWWREKSGYGQRVFAETSVVRDVRIFCDLARSSQTIGLLYGPNQSGKTSALVDYSEAKNHGRTPYVRMPAGGATKLFLEALARACSVRLTGYNDLRDAVLRHFKPHMLLIVDEFHQTMIGRRLQTLTIEIIREINDSCGCGVVLCGTDVVPSTFNDPKFKSFLGQIDNRGVLRRRIPSEPSADDVRKICAGYGLPSPGRGTEASQIVRRIAREAGIGRLTKYLGMSRHLAARRNQALSWEHFLITWSTLRSWETGDVAAESEVES